MSSDRQYSQMDRIPDSLQTHFMLILLMLLMMMVRYGHTTFADYLKGSACNLTINIEPGTEGGTVEFKYPGEVTPPSRLYCTVLFLAKPDLYISISPAHQQRVHGDCGTTVTINNSTAVHSYCMNNTMIPEVTAFNTSVILTYDSTSANESYVQFLFYAYGESPCVDAEVECDNFKPSRCLQKKLACLNPHSVCGEEDPCKDKIPTTTIVIATLATLVFLIVAFIVSMVIHVRVCNRHKTEPLPAQFRSDSSEQRRRGTQPRSATSIHFRTAHFQTDTGDPEGRLSPPPSYDVVISDNRRGVANSSRTLTNAYVAPPSFVDAPPTYDEVMSLQRRSES